MRITGARFPGRYIQGPGLIARLGQEAACFGRKAVVILDGNLATVLEQEVRDGAAPLDIDLLIHGGECSKEEIARGVAAGRASGADMIVGIGGGKALDTSKAAAHELGNLPNVIVPTIAASDAPCSALAVVYRQDDHVMDHDYFLAKNPDLVLVDTAIIARAPARFLAAGLGDALATWYEAESSRRADALNSWGVHGAALGFEIARFCRDTIFEHGEKALAECDAKTAGPALERVVEANILLSGVGFETGGVAGAHAIHNGLTELHDAHGALHGEKVAIGVLAMLLILGDKAEHDRVRAWCKQVRLPTRLADIGVMDPDDAQLRQVAERACQKGMIMDNEPITVTPDMVVAALQQML